MNIKFSRILLSLFVIALMCNLSFATTITVNQTPGAAQYTDIQLALDHAGTLTPYDPCNPSTEPIIVEVQDSTSYGTQTVPLFANATTPALLFPANQINLTLQAADGATPTIWVGGGAAPEPNTQFIRMRSAGQMIKGFTIRLKNASTVTDNNSVCIIATGGGTTVQDCNIIGPCTANNPALGWVMGITAVANVTTCNISQFRMGVVCDLNSVVGVGFPYVITNSTIHHNHKRGIQFGNAKATVLDCTIYANGNATAPPIGGDNSSNIICDGNEPNVPGAALADILISDCNIGTSFAGRSINIQTTGTVSIENSILVQDPAGAAAADIQANRTLFDNILKYAGKLNLTGCLLDTRSGMACVNSYTGGQFTAPGTGGVTNVNHCTFIDNSANTQWALYTYGTSTPVINIKNSIIVGTDRNGFVGGLLQGSGTITSNYNDMYISDGYAGEGPNPGANDIADNPRFIQTTDDANTLTYYVIQPYERVATAGENGTYMGWKMPVAGFERYPADYTKIRNNNYFGVDFKDFAMIAKDDGNDGRFGQKLTPPMDLNSPVVLIDDFMDHFTATGVAGQQNTLLGPRSGEPNNVFWVTTYLGSAGNASYPSDWRRGGSTLSLITGSQTPPLDANSPDDPTGYKYMRWNFDLNPHPLGTGDPCYVTYTEFMYTFPHGIDMQKYQGIRVMMRRNANNPPSDTAFLYCRLLNVQKGSSRLIPDKADIIRNIGGGNPVERAGQWYQWTVNLASMNQTDAPSSWLNSGGWADVAKIGAIIIGIQTQPQSPYPDSSHSTGTIDIDAIQLSNPRCDKQPVFDLNSDCRVNFGDVQEFTKYWLFGFSTPAGPYPPFPTY